MRKPYPKFSKRPVVDCNLCNTTAISQGQGLSRAVAPSRNSHTLSQDLLQLRRGTTCYQSPYQRKGVYVKVRLVKETQVQLGTKKIF